MTLLAGARLGPYEILSPLGAGGMGEVYRARDTRLQRDVALKVLVGEAAQESGRFRRFQTEAQSTAALAHANIVAVYDIGEANGTPYIVSELLAGGTLALLVARGALPVKKLLDLAIPMANGLAAAHASGIVHRDLKPDNILLTAEGSPKIADFGLAKYFRPAQDEEGSQLTTLTDDRTKEGTIVGTVSYMSPEQAKGEAVDFRSDQFSFGSVLYEMATGKKAFRKASTVQTLAAIVQEEPEPIASLNPGVPAPLRWIVEQCLAKEPGGRYASTEDLARDLARVRGHLSETSSTVDAIAAPVSHRRRFLSILAAAALLAALGGVLTLARRAWKSPIPSFQRLTFRRGSAGAARFSPDGQTVVYGASWEGGPRRLYSTRLDNPESRPFDLPPADVLAVSSTGELAILLNFSVNAEPNRFGTLARAPLLGGAAREVLEEVQGADWSPDGKELAVIRRVGERRRLEFPIGTKLYEADKIYSPRVSPGGDLVAFVEEQAGGGSFLCTVDRAGTKRTVTEHTGFVLAWSPKGDEIWFAWTDLEAVTLSGQRRVLMKFPEPFVGELHDISRDGRVLLSLTEWRLGVAGLPPGEGQERELSWLSYSRPSEISDDGTRLLFDDGTSSGAGGVYLRTTDGSSPPVLLAREGQGTGLSPDSKWAIVWEGKASEFELVPTGSGEKRVLKLAGIDTSGGNVGARFFPDGKRILVEGRQPGRPLRNFVQNLDGGEPRPITPEGIHSQVLSPDGRLLAVLDAERRILLYPVDGGGAPRAASGPAEPGELSVWSADGRSLYVAEAHKGLARVFRRDLASGRRDLWKEIAPADRAGVSYVGPLIAPNGSYVYGYQRFLGNLYLIQGLK